MWSVSVSVLSPHKYRLSSLAHPRQSWNYPPPPLSHQVWLSIERVQVVSSSPSTPSIGSVPYYYYWWPIGYKTDKNIIFSVIRHGKGMKRKILLSNESSSLSAYIMREHEESTSTSLVVGSCDERKQHEKVSPVQSPCFCYFRPHAERWLIIKGVLIKSCQ